MNDALMVIIPSFLGGMGACAALGALLLHNMSVEIYNDGFDAGFTEAYNEVCAMQQYAYMQLADQDPSVVADTLDAVVKGLHVTLTDLKKGDRT